MTRISSVNDPAYQIELLKGRVEALERRNPLNNASIDSDVPGISAGSNVFNSSGFQFMWGGELRSMGSVASGLNSKADGIQSYAEGVQAYAEDIDARQSVKPTTAWVQARLDNVQAYAEDIDARQSQKPTTAWVQAQINSLQGQINNAASSGDVAAVQTELTNFKAQYALQYAVMVGRINAAIEAMEVRPGYTRPTPIPYG